MIIVSSVKNYGGEISLRVGIVGAGPSGLAAGMLLASKGFQVSIYEKNTQIGGKCSVMNDQDGKFTFDLGPTYFIMPFVLEDIFWQCNKNLHNYVDLKLLEPFYQIIYQDGSRLYPRRNYKRLKENIHQFSSADVSGLDKFLDDNSKKYENLFYALRAGYSNFKNLPKWNLISNFAHLKPFTNFWKDLEQYFENDKVKFGFTFQTKYVGRSFHKCPSLYSILSYLEYSMGVFHVMGGLNKLSKAMGKVIEELGGQIYLNCEVKQINTSDNQAKEIVLKDGSSKELDEVICATNDLNHIMKLVNKSERKKDLKVSSDVNYSYSKMVMYLGLSKTFYNLMHHSIIVPENFWDTFEELNKGEIPEDPIISVQNPCVTDPSLAEGDRSVMQLSVAVPNLNTNINWNEILIKKLQTKIINCVEKHLEIKDIEKYIEFQDIKSPQDWYENFNSPYGACFGKISNLKEILGINVNNNLTFWNNLWITGSLAISGNNLALTYEAGRSVAHEIIKKYGIEPPELVNPPVSHFQEED
ncbi:phytoene desaturase family protein [Natranaerobius thermophilus]|uniref:phytoene desaturase family protein n=1 Tax=Natranaerobius thermophilus TaxID=375929 RepID=UPI002F3FE6A1